MVPNRQTVKCVDSAAIAVWIDHIGDWRIVG